jgi:hypothetical protein
MQDPIQEISKTKRAGAVIQVIKHLPSRYKAQSSNPSSVKKKIGKKYQICKGIFLVIIL